MSRINSFDELKKAVKEFKPSLQLRENFTKDDLAKRDILVCGGTGCSSSDSMEIIENLKSEIEKAGLSDHAEVQLTGCFGFCAKGPIVKVYPDNVFYVQVKPEDAREIVQEHILNHRVVERLLFEEPALDHKKVERHDEMSFYKKQCRVALRNCGHINPENINEYIGNDGYVALGKCLTELKPEDVIAEVKTSGLRGRGGAGFPTGIKWESTANTAPGNKYVVCNADEGDPGAFMDRSVLEGDPHSVLEAMAICGYSIGADTGYIYIRAEYPLAIERLKVAIAQAEETGLLGNNIMGTGFNFNIELKYGAGAFVCGEGTALIHSIEGKRGEPRMKTYSSSKRGLWDSPTCLNNVETFANIPAIINQGASWFNSYGTEDSPGTKVFALGGKVNNVGLVEVPMGTTLREIVYEIGGGIPNGREFKAVQTGGPSGGCISAKNLDTPIDFKSLSSIGSMMGSGGMLVLDDSDCMVNISKFFLEFTVEESCGKCTPCRIGNKRLLELLTKITEGKGTEEDLVDLKDLATTIKTTSLCGLGKCAPNPVLSTLEYFYDEYLAHVKDHKCPAGKCTAMLDYYITDACKGCTMCAKVCPAGCITGNKKEQHVIDTSKCLKCGTCIDKCKFNAIITK
ncbi:NADH-quinone oxidoreductase subunit NuoF [Romboutsia ilealis]|uniref:NADH-quinone oxidoreductase subunit NuoF n=1 Tax=Romboutsia faecis TaxID=2764597 RepID=A0ABR7JPW8_9FIRM|nr:NADH-quinone oxidoreductase subunit NuoF [Romboutsia faecis]MBC5996962.1 NADH-quinone oxidoreductase subunit NuoF [Romboutsia faecis]MRN25298.1 NADH-quinone oxidoreductase subunit NuoF [Romboutsia ilealis]